MTTIRLHNTKTRKKEEFIPLNPDNVRMYVCGPTVYDRAHLGNARPVVVFDVLYRLLRHVYGPDHVTYVRNFTDVDDKINDAAQMRKLAGDPRGLEALIRERTDETINWYHADMDALGALRPNAEPRATEFIPQMVAMIADLIASGHAYEKASHVLFRVRSYKDYGRLSGRSVDDMIAGARVEVAPFKEDPMDFVLWKPSTADLPGWDSPWGRGRPGWHIECSAMSYELLGETFDIHAGGIDLQFPHHENEIAQSMCAHPHGDFAKVWLHNEMLQVEGKKMSKSLGNFFTVRDLLDKGVPGEVIRFVMLMTHYSKPMDWTEKKREEAAKRLNNLLPALGIARGLGAIPTGRFDDLPQDVGHALANDLNTSAALTYVEGAANVLVQIDTGELVVNMGSARSELPRLALQFVTALDVLGLYASLLARPVKRVGANELLDDAHGRYATRYALAKKSKDFSEADRFKKELEKVGVMVRVTKNSSGQEIIKLDTAPNFDPAKLESLK